jgi:hypothetical protein
MLDYREIIDSDADGYIYDNQFSVAKDIMTKFYQGDTKWILLQAQTQCGKTGVIRQLADYINNINIVNEMDIIDHGNLYCIMGMNDNELKRQTISRMPESTLVLHNSNIKTLIASYRKGDAKSVSIINNMCNRSMITIDESHYAQNKNSQIHQLLQLLGVSPNGNYESNVYIVSISATSMSESANNSEYKQSVLLRPGNGYYGIIDIFENNKIHQSDSLKENINIHKLGALITTSAVNRNGYVIIRLTGRKTTQTHIRTLLQNCITVQHNIIDYSMISKQKSSNTQNNNTLSNIITLTEDISINDILSVEPDYITIIYIKNRLRAGVSLTTDYILFMYDSCNSGCDVVGQSLLGRMCGYNRSGLCEVYCNKVNAKKYLKWIQNDFDINHIPNSSKNITISRPKNIPIQILLCSTINNISLNNQTELINHIYTDKCTDCKISNKAILYGVLDQKHIITNYICIDNIEDNIEDNKLYNIIDNEFINKQVSHLFISKSPTNNADGTITIKVKKNNKQIKNNIINIIKIIKIFIITNHTTNTSYLICNNIGNTKMDNIVNTTHKEMFNL